MNPLGLYCVTADQASHGRELCERYGFVWLEALPETGHALRLDAERLALLSLGRGAPGPVWVDFVAGRADWRRRHGGGRGQGVAKACGLKNGTPRVLDATAGLGRDAFVLASLGCHLDLVERSPVAAALLEDGLARAAADAEVGPIVARMRLWHRDAASALADWHGERPEVIYLDPMFPEKNKSALSKKEMQAFQTVIGPDLDADALLAPARALANSRVAVKRPRHAPWLAGVEPGLVYQGDSVRYDVYL
ncbi:class I SAM-dependent methyltransferase [Chitinimonas lacunae]|uniref:Ribosomal RNA small subunit methyltransferase J n=1 Tax=Chitinimonas lacunae TaxID=1963018 RepID=A0ABV8MVH1_9NEIS